MADWRRSPFMVTIAALHIVALVFVIAAPQRWPAVLAFVLVMQAAIVIAGLLPRCPFLGPNIRRVRGARDVVALTFDDGPDPDVTPEVLDILDGAGARATFFCIGRKAESNPELVAAIRQRGHDVQNHSYSHPNLFALHGPRSMEREIVRAQDAIEKTAGVRPRFFRAPAGIQCSWLFPVLSRSGIALVSWTRRGFDTVTREPDRVASRLIRGLRAGDILLLHDGSSARAADGRPVVLEALTRVLDALQKKGLRSERLDILL